MHFLKAFVAVAAGYQIVAAIPAPQNSTQVSTQNSTQNSNQTFTQSSGPDICSYSARDPTTWQRSGARELVNKFITEHGQKRWLYELDKTMNGDSAAIACATMGATGCITPPARCETYDPKSYYFVLTMMARVNEVFTTAQRKLTSSTIKDVLAIGKIIDDFQFPGDPNEGADRDLRTVASALSMADKVAKQFFGPIGDILGFVGGAVGIAAAQLRTRAIDYASLERDMEQWLSDMFEQTEDIMSRALASMVGEGEDGDTILEDLHEQMRKMGNTHFETKYKSTISNVLANGAFIRPASESDVSEAFEEGFKYMRHGLIGQYLAGLRTYVQRDDMTPAQHCDEKRGQMWDGYKCYTLRYESAIDGKSYMFSEETVSKFEGEYGLSLREFIRNVAECNNGEFDEDDLNISGNYPKCYFGLAFADYVDGPTGRRDCYTNYKNWETLPSWIFSRERSNTKDCKEFKVPGNGDCLINSNTRSNWYENALRRYRTHFSGNGVDIGKICGYIDCVGDTNVQCFKAEEGGYLVDISFVQGPLGKSQNDDCIRKARNNFQLDYECRTG